MAGENELPTTSLDVLRSLTEAIGHLAPELRRTLGHVAVGGVTAESQHWVEELADAIGAAYAHLEPLYEAINELPVYDGREPEVVEADEETIASEPLVESAVDVESDLDVTPEPEVELVDEMLPVADEVEEDQWDLSDQSIGEPTEPTIADGAEQSEIDLLGLTPNERSAVLRALEYLNLETGRRRLSDITTAVFGRSRLPSGEENRLVQIFDRLVVSGQLRSYGRTYGIAEGEARIADSNGSNEEAEDKTKEEEAIYEHVVRLSIDHPDSLLNIGQIIRTYTGQDRVNRESFDAIVDILNGLADRGLLGHERQSPWYSVPEDAELPKRSETALEPRRRRTNLPNIMTPVLYPVRTEESAPTPVDDIVEPAVEVDMPDATQPVPVTHETEIVESPEKQTSIFEVIDQMEALSDREKEMTKLIFTQITSSDWFAGKDIDFTSIGFVSDMSRLRAFSDLGRKLLESGLLEGNGKARGGSKYRIPLDLPSFDRTAVEVKSTAKLPDSTSAPTTATTNREAKQRGAPAKQATPQRERVRYYDRVTQDFVLVEEETKPKRMSDGDMRKAALFTERLVHVVARMETKRRTDGVKSTVIVKEFADQLGLSLAEGKKLVAELEQGGLLVVPANQPHHKGTRILTTKLELSGEEAEKSGASATVERQDAEAERVRSLREQYGNEIVKYLSTLVSKFSSEYKTAIAAALNDEVDVEDINLICRLMLNEGLLESVMPKGRGTGRKRKGMTWRLTGRGRALANELSRTSLLTNAEKKNLGKSFSS